MPTFLSCVPHRCWSYYQQPVLIIVRKVVTYKNITNDKDTNKNLKKIYFVITSMKKNPLSSEKSKFAVLHLKSRLGWETLKVMILRNDLWYKNNQATFLCSTKEIKIIKITLTLCPCAKRFLLQDTFQNKLNKDTFFF